jgi:hypothetical protein
MGRLLSAMLILLISASICVPSATADPPEQRWHRETVTLMAPDPTVTNWRDGTCRVELEGYPNIADPGHPALPLKCFNVLVHPGIDWTTLSIELLGVAEETLAGSYRVAPAPAVVVPIDDGAVRSQVIWGDGKLIVDGRDMHVYAADADYPGDVVKLSGASQKRAVRFARILFCPVQYDPVQGALRVVSAANVRISYAYQPEAVALLGDSAAAAPDFGKFVNADSLAWAYQPKPRVPGKDGRDTYDYVIITTNHIAADSTKLGDYIAHKTVQGFSILVKTIEDIEAEYTMALRPELFETTDERADRIRAYLKDNYLNYGIEYVLLIGNPDPDDPNLPHDAVGDVPMKFCYPDNDINPYHAPTDSYYTDLTGQWDLDGDGIYGEWDGDRGIGGVDLAGFEVIVGRIPYYSADLTWLDSILQKIIDYEALGADQSWKRRCFMPNPIDWSDSYGREGNTSPVWMAEWIKENVLVPEGFGYYRIYEHNYDYPPHNVSPLPEQIPEDLGYTCFTRYDSEHYFKAGVNVASDNIDDYTITELTDGSYATVWSASDFSPDAFVQFKTAHPEDAGAAYAPYKMVLYSDDPAYFPQQFEIEMAYNANFSDAFQVASETDAAAHAVRVGPYWHLDYVAPDDLSRVGGKQYIRLTYTGSNTQGYVQINEFSGYTEEAASIQPYVIPEWQNGYGVVYFNTHGWPQGAGEIIASDECGQLDNTRPSFVFSKACSTAYPEASDNLCAQLVKEGGIASCGATRVSYGWGDQGYQLLMPKLINENKPFGDVICEVRADMENADWYGWAGLYFDAMKFNIYGDPTVRLITEGALPGDVDGDGDVDLQDLAALLSAYGACDGDPDYNAAADFDSSGCVDLSDLATLLSNYGVGT